MKQYGIYNIKDCEQCEYFGTKKEIAKYLGLNVSYLSAYLARKKKGKKGLLRCKYELIEIKGEK